MSILKPFLIFNKHKSLLKNSGWIFVDKFLKLGLNLVVGVVLARYMGPNEFGEFAYVVAFISLFQGIANLGLDGIAVRDLAQQKKIAQNLLGTVFILRFIAGILCWLLAVFIMVCLNGWSDRSVFNTVLIGLALVFQASETIDLWFQSQGQSNKSVIPKSFVYLLTNSVKIYLIVNNVPLSYFCVAMAAEGLLVSIALFYSYNKFKCEGRWKYTKNLCKKLLSESWPLIISGLSIMIYMRIDQIMIKNILGAKELGVYAAVLPLATMWQILPVVLNASLGPIVATKKIESEVLYWRILKNIFSLYSCIAWCSIILTLTLGHVIVPYIFGKNYIDGVIVLSIYIFTNLFINMGMAQSLWFLNEYKVYRSLVNTVVGAFVCIVGNLILLPTYGLIGVALVAVLSQFFSTVITNLIYSRRIFWLQIESIFMPFYKTNKI